MTRIVIGEGFCEIGGHAPDPAVCHGISAISQMVGNYLERGGLEKKKKGDGYLRITQNRKARQTEGTGILFGAVYRAFMDIAEEYPGNIEIDLAGKEDWP